MGSESSLPCSQKCTTDLCPEPKRAVSTINSIYHKIYFDTAEIAVMSEAVNSATLNSEAWVRFRAIYCGI